MNFIPDWGLLQRVHRFFDTESKDDAPAGMSRRDFLKYTGGAAAMAAAPLLFIPPQKVFVPATFKYSLEFDGKRYPLAVFNKLEVVGIDWGMPLDQVGFLAIQRDIMQDMVFEEDRKFLEALRG